jgi:broad specificity phosphatase PhoE
VSGGGTAPPASPQPPGAGQPDRRVVLVRHGETAWSHTGQHTGRSDIPLDPKGEVQARLVGRRLAGWHFAAVLTSPLERARRTCELAGLGVAAALDPDLEEWDYGRYDGLTSDQIRAERPGWTIWAGGVVGGESVDQVGERADRVLRRVGSVGGDVAIFAHGHLLRILAARWCALDPDDGEHLALDPASVSVLGHEHGSPVISLWNDTSHLAGRR